MIVWPSLLAEQNEFERLVLGGLALDEATAILSEQAGGDVALAVARQLLRSTGGNPLALSEIARQLTSQQLRGLSPLPTPLPTPRELGAQLLARVGALPDATRRALLVLAIAEGIDAVARQRVLNTLELPDSVFAPAEVAGIARLEDGRNSLTHPLMSAAVYNDASPGDRRLVHRCFADAEGDLPLDRKAFHLARSAVATDEHIASVLETAAADARNRSAYASAGQALVLAANLSADRDARVRRLVGAATDLQVAGRFDEAAALCADAERETDDAVVRARVRRRWASVEMFRSGPRMTAAMLRRDIAHVAEYDLRSQWRCSPTAPPPC